MSASREKKARQGLGADYVSPQQKKLQEEESSAKRTTTIFVLCAAALLLFVIGIFVWNSKIIQRNSPAARINGVTYTAGDMAYYYYNSRISVLNSTNGNVNTQQSLREQMTADGTRSWYDYVTEDALNIVTKTQLTVQAAKDAGFDGGEELESAVKDALDKLNLSAANSGSTPSQYLKAVFGPLMNRSTFERNLRQGLLAEQFIAHSTSITNYTDEQLNAVLEADTEAYQMVDYEYLLFLASDYNMDGSSDNEAALATAKSAAESAVEIYQSTNDLKMLSEQLECEYARTFAYPGTSELSSWLFDNTRKQGDCTILDYYGMGYWVLVFHDKRLAAFNPVDVRHILVADEAAANDLLAQFNAGDKSEESFAELARANSTDSGSAEDGGLYTGVYYGQMVQPFEDWCFDPSRQPGDTGIVQTDYGYHVMYFVCQDPYAYWQYRAAAKLSSEWAEQLSKDASSELLDGMKYIDE